MQGVPGASHSQPVILRLSTTNVVIVMFTLVFTANWHLRSLKPESRSDIVNDEECSCLVTQLSSSLRKLLGWQLQIPEQRTFSKTTHKCNIITNLIRGDQSLPAISVVEGTDDDSGQVVFTGCGRLQQAACTVVLVTHLLSVVWC